MSMSQKERTLPVPLTSSLTLIRLADGGDDHVGAAGDDHDDNEVS